MSMLIDTNVLSYAFGDVDGFSARAVAALKQADELGPIVINPIIYAELCGLVRNPALLDNRLQIIGIERDDLPWDAAPAAAEAFRKYRAKGGPRPSLLPDFYIGAHALVRGYSLLSFDERRYRAYFPGVLLIVPAA